MPSAAETLDLRSLWMALQPIVDLGDGRVVGHEALVRGPAGPWAEPSAISAEARRTGRAEELEETCRRLALAAGSQLPAEQRLFVNVDVRYRRRTFDADLTRLGAERVAIEVSEQCEVMEHPHVLQALHRLRARGCRLVLDDYGTGQAGLSTLLAVQPDVIKVDRSFVAGMVHDRRHRTALEAVVRLARDLGVEVVAEGIETAEQLGAVRDLGVPLGQGFLLGRPGPHAVVGPVRGAVREVRPVAATVASEPVQRFGTPDSALAAFHEEFFENTDVAAYYVDRRRTILRWNAAAEAVTGFAAGDVVGRRCMAGLLDHTSLAGAPLCWGGCPLVHAMADGRPREDTILLRHRSGQRLEVTVRAIPVRDEQGRVVGAVETFRRAATPAP